MTTICTCIVAFMLLATVVVVAACMLSSKISQQQDAGQRARDALRKISQNLGE